VWRHRHISVILSILIPVSKGTKILNIDKETQELSSTVTFCKFLPITGHNKLTNVLRLKRVWNERRVEVADAKRYNWMTSTESVSVKCAMITMRWLLQLTTDRRVAVIVLTLIVTRRLLLLLMQSCCNVSRPAIIYRHSRAHRQNGMARFAA